MNTFVYLIFDTGYYSVCSSFLYKDLSMHDKYKYRDGMYACQNMSLLQRRSLFEFILLCLPTTRYSITYLIFNDLSYVV